MNSDMKNSIVEPSSKDYLSLIISLSEEIFHDFKNNLATISGISQMTAYLEVTDEVKENMDIITKATFECRDQIDRFYKYIKGYNVDVYRDEILSNIVFTCMDLIKHRISKLDDNVIDLSVNIHSMSKIYCNEYKMRQAILNILINAIEAMEERGGNLEINLFDQSDNIVLEIIDSGIGIPEDKLEKIFESNYTTKGEKGTGLGLVVSKTKFEKCGGRLEVKSELGKGSIFTILLPINNSLNEEDILL